MKFELRRSVDDKHVEIASKLLHARTQIHVFHFQSLSYSKHVALDELYTSILEKLDLFVETVQGKLSSILKGYKSYPLQEELLPVEFLRSLKTDVENYRKSLSGSDWDNIDNQMQTIVDDVEKTIYKLTFLN